MAGQSQKVLPKLTKNAGARVLELELALSLIIMLDVTEERRREGGRNPISRSSNWSLHPAAPLSKHPSLLPHPHPKGNRLSAQDLHVEASPSHLRKRLHI